MGLGFGFKASGLMGSKAARAELGLWGFRATLQGSLEASFT